MAVWIPAALLLSALAVCDAQAAPAQTPVESHPSVQKIPLSQPTAARLKARKSSYKVTVPGDGDWVDTELTVAPGDSVEITATGDVSLSDGRKVTPDGTARGWKDLLRQFPDNNSPAGALVGRRGGLPTSPADGDEGKQLLALAKTLGLPTEVTQQ